MLKRNRFGLMAVLALALAATAWGQETSQPKTPAPTEKPAATAPQKPAATAPQKPAAKPAESPDTVVLKVGDESFTKADLDYLFATLNPRVKSALEREGRKPLGEQYALMAALSQKALQEHLNETPDFKRQMAFQRTQALAQAEYKKLEEGIKITPEEVSQFYNSHSSEFDRAQVREFFIRKKADNAPASAPGLSNTEAHARADSIRKALASGTDPKQVAEKFSTPNVVMIDAQPRSISRGQLIPTLDKAAFDLKDGQLSDPYETPQGLAFVQVVGHERAQLKDVSENIENALTEEKLKGMLNDVKSKTNIWMDDQYFSEPPKPEAEPAPPEPKE